MRDTATFAGGCFWGIEAAFRRVKGVSGAAAGYAGGSSEDPTYKSVCAGNTGHAEAVQVEYDTTQVSYDALLDVFFSIHDPTSRTRQTADPGYQYRSAIFFHSPQQKAAALAFKEKHAARSGKHVVTEITPASRFYRAEDYHQQYLEKHKRA